MYISSGYNWWRGVARVSLRVSREEKIRGNLKVDHPSSTLEHIPESTRDGYSPESRQREVVGIERT